MKLSTIKYISCIVLVLGIFFSAKSFAGDLMEQAFSTAKSYESIINLGDTKEAVGNQILRESQTLGINDNLGQGCFINGQHTSYNKDDCTLKGGDWNVSVLDTNKREPLMVRIAKFLLRMTIVLAITMVIINAIFYMTEVINGKDFGSAEAKKNLIGIAGGIVLALSSIAIINLIGSLSKSSLKTSEDLGDATVGCNTGGVIIAGDDLKKWICGHSLFGHDPNTLQYREWKVLAPFSHSANTMEEPALGGARCWICNEGTNGCKWKKIYTSEMRDKCVEDMGGEPIN